MGLKLTVTACVSKRVMDVALPTCPSAGPNEYVEMQVSSVRLISTPLNAPLCA